MVNDAGDEVVQIDLIALDDAVITLDPIETAPIAIDETLPSDGVDFITFDMVADAPQDAQTFGGPDDGAVTEIPVDSGSDEGSADAGSSDGDIVIDDGLIYTTFVVDDVVIDVAADGSSEEGGTEDGTLPDDGLIYTTTVVDGDVVTTDDTATDPVDFGDDVVIGRPVDPEPNWRTLDGTDDSATDGSSDADGGTTDPVVDGGVIDEDLSGTEGNGDLDIGIIACDDYPVYKGEDGDTDGTETPTDVIYTLDPSDPLIYATSTGVLDAAPGRAADPEPNWRGGTAPAVNTAAPETHADVVHYAASESFQTGLDLL